MNLLEILTKRNLIKEGIEDPAILKCIFFAGGPGAGKSYLLKNIFNVTEDLPLSSYGLKVIASDREFEMLLKQNNISTDLSSLPPEEFNKLTVGPDSLRNKARSLTAKKLDMYKKKRLGIIIDFTGDQISKLQDRKDRMTQFGYDCYMIFVNTDLDIALERNRKRYRKLPEDIVKKIWANVHRNLGHYQSIFGRNFTIIDNSQPGPLNKQAVRAVIDFVTRPVENPIGKSWIRNYYKLKQASKMDVHNQDDGDNELGDEWDNFDIKRDPMSSKSTVVKKDRTNVKHK